MSQKIKRIKNLFQLAMIVKNSADTIKETLESYIPIIDYWCILDTGSNDGTQDIIKETMKNIPGKLYEEPFQGFSKSRNRCLDLVGYKCIYNIMPDDSYILKNPESLVKQLNRVRYPVVDIIIKTQNEKYPDTNFQYFSKRISMSRYNIRYEGDIHEDLILDSDYTLQETTYILDTPKGTQHERTLERKLYDLSLLKDTPRDLYYKGMVYVSMKQYDKALENFKKRVEFNDDDNEEKFVSFINIGHITGDINYYLRAALLYPDRSGEAYFFMYLISKNIYWIDKAYENRILGEYRLPVDTSIYQKQIPELYKKLHSLNINEK